MKDYVRFSVKDFIMDEYFQSWVFNPAGNVDAFWQTWLEENPDKRADVEEARSTLMRLNFSRFEMSSSDVSQVWNKIRHSGPHPTDKPHPFNPKILLWSGAAAAMLLIGFSSFFWTTSDEMTEYRTAFGETKTITLPDGRTLKAW